MGCCSTVPKEHIYVPINVVAAQHIIPDDDGSPDNIIDNKTEIELLSESNTADSQRKQDSVQSKTDTEETNSSVSMKFDKEPGFIEPSHDSPTPPAQVSDIDNDVKSIDVVIEIDNDDKSTSLYIDDPVNNDDEECIITDNTNDENIQMDVVKVAESISIQLQATSESESESDQSNIIIDDPVNDSKYSEDTTPKSKEKCIESEERKDIEIQNDDKSVSEMDPVNELKHDHDSEQNIKQKNEIRDVAAQKCIELDDDKNIAMDNKADIINDSDHGIKPQSNTQKFIEFDPVKETKDIEPDLSHSITSNHDHDITYESVQNIITDNTNNAQKHIELDENAAMDSVKERADIEIQNADKSQSKTPHSTTSDDIIDDPVNELKHDHESQQNITQKNENITQKCIELDDDKNIAMDNKAMNIINDNHNAIELLSESNTASSERKQDSVRSKTDTEESNSSVSIKFGFIEPPHDTPTPPAQVNGDMDNDVKSIDVVIEIDNDDSDHDIKAQLNPQECIEFEPVKETKDIEPDSSHPIASNHDITHELEENIITDNANNAQKHNELDENTAMHVVTDENYDETQEIPSKKRHSIDITAEQPQIIDDPLNESIKSDTCHPAADNNAAHETDDKPQYIPSKKRHSIATSYDIIDEYKGNNDIRKLRKLYMQKYSKQLQPIKSPITKTKSTHSVAKSKRIISHHKNGELSKLKKKYKQRVKRNKKNSNEERKENIIDTANVATMMRRRSKSRHSVVRSSAIINKYKGNNDIAILKKKYMKKYQLSDRKMEKKRPAKPQNVEDFINKETNILHGELCEYISDHMHYIGMAEFVNEKEMCLEFKFESNENGFIEGKRVLLAERNSVNIDGKGRIYLDVLWNEQRNEYEGCVKFEWMDIYQNIVTKLVFNNVANELDIEHLYLEGKCFQYGADLEVGDMDIENVNMDQNECKVKQGVFNMVCVSVKKRSILKRNGLLHYHEINIWNMEENELKMVPKYIKCMNITSVKMHQIFVQNSS